MENNYFLLLINEQLKQSTLARQNYVQSHSTDKLNLQLSLILITVTIESLFYYQGGLQLLAYCNRV